MSDTALSIHLNGEIRMVPAHTTLAALLGLSGYRERRVAVEINGEIVPRSQHAHTVLADGDRIEIVQAIGGG